MRIFDCFPFFNELDILEIRLRELAKVVDRFVLVEANETQTGLAKPFIFEENKARFTPWLDRITHIKVTFPKSLPRAEGKYGQMGGWEREHYQRNQIQQGLVEAEPDDLVIVSDVDEIVNARTLRSAIEEGRHLRRLLIFEQTHHRFKLDLIAPGSNWLLGSRALQCRHLTTPQSLRRTRVRLRQRPFVPKSLSEKLLQLRNRQSTGIGLPVDILRDGGWHFTSIGSFERYADKMRSVVEGDEIIAQVPDRSVRGAYDRARMELRKFPRTALPDCVQGGDYTHLMDTSSEAP